MVEDEIHAMVDRDGKLALGVCHCFVLCAMEVGLATIHLETCSLLSMKEKCKVGSTSLQNRTLRDKKIDEFNQCFN